MEPYKLKAVSSVTELKPGECLRDKTGIRLRCHKCGTNNAVSDKAEQFTCVGCEQQIELTIES